MPENLARIIAVERYLQNTHVGFMAYGIEISHVFVMSCLAKMAATIASVLPLLLTVVDIPSLKDIQCSAEAVCDAPTDGDAEVGWRTSEACEFNTGELQALQATMKVFANESCSYYNYTVDYILNNVSV